jgi:hypothetical protein
MLNFNDRDPVQIMSSGRKFDRIILGILSFLALAAVIGGVIFSIDAIDSFAHTDLTTASSTQDRERNATTAVA